MDKRLEILEKWGKAHKAKDIRQLEKLYAEDSLFLLGGTEASSTALDAKAVTGYNAAVGSDWAIKDARLEADHVHAALTEKNDWMQAAGIHEAHYEGDFIIKNGRIEAVHLKPTSETKQAQTKVLTEFSEWAAKERPEKYSEVMAEGRLLYKESAGKALVELMHQWRESR